MNSFWQLPLETSYWLAHRKVGRYMQNVTKRTNWTRNAHCQFHLLQLELMNVKLILNFLVVTFPGKSSSQVCWSDIRKDIKEYCDPDCCPWPWKISCLGTVFSLCCCIWVCLETCTCRTQCCQQNVFFFLNTKHNKFCSTSIFSLLLLIFFFCCLPLM